MLVAIITQIQKDSIIGHKFGPDSYFNPIQDYYGNWVISEVEVTQCTNPDFEWVNSLTLSEYVPGPPPGPTGQNV